MKNNFKKTLLGKVISLFAVAAMLMALVPGALVSAATYSIAGDAMLYAPPAGRVSAVTYTISDVSDVVLTISKVDDNTAIPTGVSVAGNRIILDGSVIEAGKFKLTAKSAADETVTAQKTVTINNVRIFSDFNDLVAYDGEGNETNFQMSDIGVPFPTLSGGEYTPVDTDDAGWMTGYAKGGKALGTKDSAGSYPVIYAGNLTNKLGGRPKVATVEVDILVSDDTETNRFGEGKYDWAIGWTKDSNLTVDEGTTVTELKVKPNEMNRCHVIVDYNKHTYTPGVDGVTGTTAYNMVDKNTSSSSQGYDFLWRVKSFSDIDNLAIYSGEPVYDILTVDGSYSDGKISAEGAHTAKARIDVQLAENETKQLILAHFLADGTLNKAKVAKAAAAGTASLTAELEDISGGYVKVFLWDEGLVPLDAEIPAYFSK